MAFTLYNAPQSTCSQRVRFTLHEKNLAFFEHKLDLFSGDQLRPEYLKINPNGVVPSLVHNGNVIIGLVKPNFLPSGPRASWKERLASLRDVWATLVLFLFVIQDQDAPFPSLWPNILPGKD